MAAAVRRGRESRRPPPDHGGEIHDHGSGALAHLINARRPRPIGSQALPLTEARAAYTQGLARHNRGKTVLGVA